MASIRFRHVFGGSLFVRLSNAHLTGTSRLFPNRSTTLAIGPEQHPVVWTPILQSESEGPAFIFRAARLLQAAFFKASFPRRRGAPSSA